MVSRRHTNVRRRFSANGFRFFVIVVVQKSTSAAIYLRGLFPILIIECPDHATRQTTSGGAEGELAGAMAPLTI